MKVKANANLERAIFALEEAQSGTKEAMRQRAVEAIDRAWSPALAAASGTTPERRVLASGASSSVGPGSMQLVAGAGGPLSGGLTSDGWAALEFGMTPVQSTTTKRRKKIRIAGSGRPMVVATTIWVGRNLKARNELGYVIFPTVRKHGPRFVAAWIYGLIDKWVGTEFDVR